MFWMQKEMQTDVVSKSFIISLSFFSIIVLLFLCMSFSNMQFPGIFAYDSCLQLNFM